MTTAVDEKALEEPTVEEIVATPTIPLTLSDRCCACASGTSQAFVRVLIRNEEGEASEFLLCGHHYAKNEVALASRDTVLGIQDEREKINEKPSQSSV